MAQESDTEQLRAELRSLGDTLEEVLRSSGDKSKAELEKLRDKAETVLKESRERLNDTGDRITAQAREATQCADAFVHKNPWTGVGIGAAVGVVLGLLLARR
ncbi:MULTISPECIES: DUF883 family protein [Dickeya]|uniref:DUF883 domain-containing protein n=1 Tax=Dickeya zeae (strain Ech586) TaxID=590409 RepID=D2BRN9_DICZ5|nr:MULTISPECIES: YqjD family protein [Dickeya]ACZ75443.1 protein of unknown function DUF883 ElaB [Dickeya parazeae Ech586]MBP2834399.1 DUF883 domain-containing protein [Dickeya parazeae]UCZ76636.1 YqjD family protein [Dickeya zeae]